MSISSEKLIYLLSKLAHAMSDGDNSGPHRRGLLKKMSGLAASVAVSTGSVSATAAPEKESIEILELTKVERILSMAGDPEIERKIVREESAREGEEVVLETDVGTLQYVDFQHQETEEDMALRFQFDDLQTVDDAALPEEFHSVPEDATLSIVNDAEADLDTRRTLTDREEQFLFNAVSRSMDAPISDPDIVNGVYSDKLDGVYFQIGNDNRSAKFEILSQPADRESRSLTVGTDLASVQLREIDIERVEEGPSTEDACGGLIFHPCAECVATGGAGAACAPSCAASFGATCLACIAAIGYASNTCCNCLYCADGIPEGEIPKKCPEDVDEGIDWPDPPW